MLSQWAAADGRLIAAAGNFQGLLTAHADSGDKRFEAFAGFPVQFLAQPAVSPDGRWMAYASSEGGGQVQVYVVSLGASPGRWQISTRSGYMPRWTRGGKELLFEGDGGVMAVDIDTREGFRVGTPTLLFTLPMGAGSANEQPWTCTEDGQRFFLLVTPKQTQRGEIEVVTDFNALVNRK